VVRSRASGPAVAIAAVTGAALVVHDAAEPRLAVALAILAAFALAGELFPIRFAGHQGELAISSAFLLAVLVLAGPVAAVAIQAATTLIAELAWRKPLRRLAYNVVQLVVCWALAGMAWTALHDAGAAPLGANGLIAAGAAALVFFACNLTLARLPIAFLSGRPVLATLRASLGFEAWTTVILFSLSPVIVTLALDNPLLLPTLALPVLAIQRGSRAAAANEFLANHDGLTGLPNRAFLDSGIATLLGDGSDVAVLVLDLAQFKDINDTLGHPCGDELLRAVGGRLAGAAPAEAIVARLGGDEFAVALPGTGGVEASAELAGDLLAALDAPFAIGALDLRVGAAIGIACAPAHGDEAAVLLQRADVAMHVAKAHHRPWAVYDGAQDHHSPLRLQLASELRDALARGELELHYQPLVTLADLQLDRVEALIRWRHPERGMIPPDQFVPLAERTGLIRELTSFALGEALAQIRRWRDEGLRTRVAVNLSVHNLADEHLARTIAERLEHNRLEPAVLELELTESMIMADPEHAARVLGELRAMGLELAVDDFGTGYSSLSYLRQLPVSSLKIDRSFVGAMQSDEGNATIVSAIVELAHTLGLEITAEGIEEPAVRDRLRRLGVQRAQGYLFSRPLPAEELAAWARENAATAIGTATLAAPADADRPESAGALPPAARTRRP
jgi:diguanylate cyclase (GGDEF)-like protein